MAREKQLREAQDTAAQVIPKDSPIPVPQAVAPIQPGPIKRLAAALPPPPMQPRPFMTLDEASQYTGLGKSYIAAHVEGLNAGPHGAMVYRRRDLDAL